MALSEQIQNDMKAALLGGNRFEGEVLRGLKAAILNEEVATGARESGLGDEQIQVIIAREVKKRRESYKLYIDNDRADLAENEQREMAVLETYLPQQLSEDEIRLIAAECVQQLGASSPQQMGQVIGAVKAKAGMSADGAVIARVVKELLTQ